MTAPGLPPVPVRETLREGRSRGPAAHDRVPRLPRFRPAAPAARPAARHRRGLPRAAAARWSLAPVAGQGARGHRPAHDGPRHAGRGRHHRAGLGLGPVERDRLDEVTEVWHLAAVYDLAVAPQVARRVNVDGTDQRARPSAASCPRLRRLQYVSTCYVSGRYDGRVHRGRPRGGPGVPQPLRGDQVRGRAARAQGDGRRPARHDLPPRHRRRATRRPARPRSTTAPTSSPPSSRRQPAVAVVPAVGDADSVRVCLVPRDFVVDAMDELSVLDELGRPDLRPDRPRPADRPRGRRRRSPGTSASGWCGCRCRCAPRTRSSSTCPAWSGCSACPPRPSTTSPRRRRTRPATRPATSTAPGWAARPSPTTPTACSTSCAAHPEIDANAMV